MIEAVDFVSKAVFVEAKPRPGWAAISIGNPAEMAPRQLGSYLHALRMDFLDCDLAGLAKWGYPEEALCQPEQVSELLAFVRERHADPAPSRILVHCHMGSSRSAAVALVVAHMTGCDFPRAADTHFANLHVLALAGAQLGVVLNRPPQPAGSHEYLPAFRIML